MRPFFWISFLCCLSVPLSAQNLVPNPGFESKKMELCLPAMPSDFQRAMPPWKSPTTGSPDVLSMRAKKSCKMHPHNHTIALVPHGGKNMVGISVYTNMETREYLQCRLPETLVTGKQYHISFWVARQYGATVAMSGLGIHFTSHELKNEEASTLYLKPTVQFDQTIESHNQWVQLSADFIAEGPFQYLTIGNFQNNTNTAIKAVRPGKWDWSYVYLDDLSLTRVAEEVVQDESPTIAKTLPLTVKFEVDSDQIPAVAFADLDALGIQMESNPELVLEIIGHTDDQGTAAENEDLSLRRAKAIALFLMTRGIVQERIKCLGMGSKAPISSNDSEAGRQQNRRVEFRLIAH